MVYETNKFTPRQIFRFNVFSWLQKSEKSENSNQHERISSESTILDEDDERNFDWEVKYVKLPLRICGLWPYDNDLLSHLLWLLIIVLGWTYVIPVIVGTVQVGTTQLADRQIRYISDASLITFVNVQTILGKFKRSEIKSILERMRKNWRYSTKFSEDNRKPMIIYGAKSKIVIGLCVASFCAIGGAHFTEPFINGEWLLKKLPTYGIYPFSTNSSPGYELVVVMQVVQAISGIIAAVGMDGFFAISVLHGCGQLNILSKTIRRYTGTTRHAPSLDGDENRSIDSPCTCLKCIVDHHVTISKYIEMIDDTFNGIVMARLIMTTLCFCGSGHRIIRSSETRNFHSVAINIVFLFARTCDVVTCCWIGQQLLEESEKVGRMVYELPWYTSDAKVARSLILLMIRSQKPIKITAAKFFVMSFECFQQWFIKSMGYLSVVLAVETQT